MKVLIDTCVVSEVRHPLGDQRVKEAVAALKPHDSFLSAITIGELQRGIVLLPEGQRRKTLMSWLNNLKTDVAERILTFDVETALIWGGISARIRQSGLSVAVPDVMIAATAVRHDMTVMTRNVSDFEPTGVSVFNPWE